MKFLRIQSLWWLITLLSHGLALTPLEAIQSYPQLSTLQNYINGSANFSSILGNANNFTFLAPSNDAFNSFATQNMNVTNKDLLLATLQYSLLQGGYPTLSFSNTPQFVPTNLVNGSYSNVTGGQRVELVLGGGGTPQIVTGNKSISTSTSDIVSTGGIIHIINEVIAVPISAVLEVTAAGLEYFVSILNAGGFLNAADTYVNSVLEISDVTFFIPNSAQALANATALAKSSTPAQQQALFEYHVIPGFVAYSPLLTNGMQLKTAQGTNVTVTIQDGDTYINAAKITSFDYIVANGVVHVLDTLLNPNDTSLPPLPTSTSSTAATSTPAPTTSATPTANAAATSTPSHSTSSKGLSSGAKAGIGVGVAIGGILILAALAWFLLLKRKEKRDSGPWDDRNMSGVPEDMGKFYVQRGNVQRKPDLGLGLQSTGMHEIQNAPEDRDSKNISSYGGSTATARTEASRPSVPPRSPSRLASGNEFF